MESVRSYLCAGLATGLTAGLVAAAAVTSPAPPRPLPVMSYPAVQLSAAVAALPKPAASARPTRPTTSPFPTGTAGSAGERIINAYNAIEPWAQYSVELGAWAVSWLPWPIGLIAPQMTIGYNSIQPVIQASVYSVAYLIDGQVDLIGPTLANGVRTGVNNLIQGETSWIAGFFPPLPPAVRPLAPGASAKAAPAPAASGKAAARAAAAATRVAAAAVHPGDASPESAPAVQVPEPPRRATRTARKANSAPASSAPAAAASDGADSAAPAGRAARRALAKAARDAVKAAAASSVTARASR